jgi:chromosome segregation ATPase
MEAVMAVPARKIEAEGSMETRIARLESDTAHILTNMQDMRQDMKGLRQETRELNDKIETTRRELVEKIDTTRQELEAKIGELGTRFDAKLGELGTRFDAKLGELGMRCDTKFGELQKAIESINIGRIWDRVWMLLSMGTLLGVMARGFKWI